MALILLNGCSDDDGPSPQDQCDMLVDLYCDRLAECGPMFNPSTAEPGFRDSCIEQSVIRLDCSSAVSVDSSYGTCMEQLRDLSCMTLLAGSTAMDANVNLPASCLDVINLQR